MVLGRGLLACLLIGACSARLGDQSLAAPTDSAANGTDSAAGWSEPQWVQAAGGSNEYIDNQTLSSDQLEMYFCVQGVAQVQTTQEAYKQLWMMSRAAVTDQWGTPAALGSDFNTPAFVNNFVLTEESPRLSTDDLTLYWGRQGNIFYAQRGTRQGPWTVMGPLGQVNVAGHYQKWLAVCGNKFIVSRGPQNGSSMDLYEGQLGSGNGPGTLVTEMNVGSNQISTFLSADCLTTYFASDASGANDFQIYTATRSTPTSTWSTPAAVMTFDTATTDKDPWMSNDGLTFYFASTRFTGPNAANRAVYMSTR
jgi:hypothetical protein